MNIVNNHQDDHIDSIFALKQCQANINGGTDIRVSSKFSSEVLLKYEAEENGYQNFRFNLWRRASIPLPISWKNFVHPTASSIVRIESCMDVQLLVLLFLN